MLSRYHRLMIHRVCRALFGVAAALALLVSGAYAQSRDAHTPPKDGKLTLEQCIDIALHRNSQVLIAKSQVESAEAQSFGAWSNVMPTINSTLFNGSRSTTGARVFSQDVPVGQNPDGSVIIERRQTTQPGRTLNNFSLNVNLQQPIFNGGRSWNTIKQNRQNTRNSKMNVTVQEHTAVGNVKRQYYNLLKAMALRDVNEEQVKLNEEQLKRSQSMYEIGTVAKVDMLQARATLGNARIALYNQETAVLRAKAALNTAMGLNVNSPLHLVDPVASESLALPPPPPTFDEAVQIAMRENPSFKQLRGNIESARIGSKIAKGALLPTINGTLSYSRFASDKNSVYGQFSKNWNVTLGLNVSLSVLNGTQTYANIDQSQANFMIAEENLEDTRRNTMLTIQQAILDLEAARQVIDLSNENILAAEESMRLAQERYRVGSGTQLDVFNAQVSLFQARSNLVSARYDYKIAQATLDEALGRPLK